MLTLTLAGRDLLRIGDLDPAEANAILDTAVQLREQPKQPLLPGATLGLYFAKHSTRTRVSFSAGIAQLGGVAMPLTPDELQLSRGESLPDTARALSCYLDAIAVPAFPRASSATSGLSFCGIIDDPVATASGSRANPNSAVVQRQSSSPMRDRWVNSTAAAYR